MTSHIRRILLLGIVVLSLLGSGVQSQIVYGQPTSARISTIYTHWSIDGPGGTTDIGQFSVPLQGFIPLHDNGELNAFVAGSSNSLTQGGTDYSLSGLADVRLQYNRAMSDDQLLLSLGVNLPTGKKKLAFEDELPVLVSLSQDYLNFPVRRFGEGLGLKAMLGGARMIGDWRAGAGAMFQYNGKYSPYDGIDNYDPGDIISVNAGADRQFEQATVGVNFIYTMYTEDKIEGTSAFKQSTSLDFSVMGQYAAGVNQVDGSLSYLVRGRNTLYVDDAKKEVKILGNEIRLAGNYLRTVGSWQLGPSLSWRNIAENDQHLGNATIFGLGAGAQRPIGTGSLLVLRATYFTGQADGGDLDLGGYQVALGVSANL